MLNNTYDPDVSSFVEDMGLGFNLGNSLDALPNTGEAYTGIDTELAWYNPRTTREMVREIRKAGFKTLRVPISWNPHVHGKDDAIDPAWLKRVQELISYGLDEGMYVMINTHHDVREGFLLPDQTHYARAEEFLRNIWQQVADAFREVDDKLIFESMNEIRIPGADYEWTPDTKSNDCRVAMENVNRLNQIFVDTVRASGVYNACRYLAVPGYSTSTEGVLWDGFVLPRDKAQNRLIVSAHIYSPAHFTFYLNDGEDVREFDPNDPKSTGPIDERMEALHEKFIKQGIPVTVDEFGTVDKNNDDDRIRCLAYTTAKARSLGIQCCYWDNGRFNEYGEAMGIFDREKLCFPDIRPVLAMLGEKTVN